MLSFIIIEMTQAASEKVLAEEEPVWLNQRARADLVIFSDIDSVAALYPVWALYPLYTVWLTM